MINFARLVSRTLMEFKDYYKILGARAERDPGRDQERLSQACPQLTTPTSTRIPAPRRNSRSGRGQRGARRRGEACGLRSTGPELEGGAGVPAAARLGCRLRILRRVVRRGGRGGERLLRGLVWPHEAARTLSPWRGRVPCPGRGSSRESPHRSGRQFSKARRARYRCACPRSMRPATLPSRDRTLRCISPRA